jgi:transcriptional regulator with XRE-family HTH domain
MSAEDEAQEIGERIIALRTALGMEQKELAGAMKISAQKLWNYEKGGVRIPVKHAGALCAATGADFDYLYRGMLKKLEPELRAAIVKASK